MDPQPFLKELRKLCDKHSVELSEMDFWLHRAEKFRLTFHLLGDKMHFSQLDGYTQADLKESLRRKCSRKLTDRKFSA
jgi:hypothetical protein